MPESRSRMLLLRAVVLAPEAAESCWREWRASADLDKPEPDVLLLLPMLADRLPTWLADDPARAMFLGICKRCWTQNHLKLREIGGVIRRLRQAGVSSVVLSGSAAWSFIYRPAVRPIESIELLIRREQLAEAAGALRTLGWAAAAAVPSDGELDRVECIWFDHGTDRLKLSWRLLPVAPEVAADYEKLSRLRQATVHEEIAGLLPPEEMLLYALAGYRDPIEVDWRCDALQIVRSGQVGWPRMRRLLRDQPQAIVRVKELRDEWGASIPAGFFREPTRLERISREYRWHVWQQRRARSFSGFVRYLCLRSWRVMLRTH